MSPCRRGCACRSSSMKRKLVVRADRNLPVLASAFRHTAALGRPLALMPVGAVLAVMVARRLLDAAGHFADLLRLEAGLATLRLRRDGLRLDRGGGGARPRRWRW